VVLSQLLFIGLLPFIAFCFPSLVMAGMSSSCSSPTSWASPCPFWIYLRTLIVSRSFCSFSRFGFCPVDCASWSLFWVLAYSNSYISGFRPGFFESQTSRWSSPSAYSVSSWDIVLGFSPCYSFLCLLRCELFRVNMTFFEDQSSSFGQIGRSLRFRTRAWW